MLGMYLSPDGNKKDQVKYMHKKATVWDTSILVGGHSTKQSMEGPKLDNTPNNEIPLICHDIKQEIM